MRQGAGRWQDFFPQTRAEYARKLRVRGYFCHDHIPLATGISARHRFTSGCGPRIDRSGARHVTRFALMPKKSAHPTAVCPTGLISCQNSGHSHSSLIQNAPDKRRLAMRPSFMRALIGPVVLVLLAPHWAAAQSSPRPLPRPDTAGSQQATAPQVAAEPAQVAPSADTEQMATPDAADADVPEDAPQTLWHAQGQEPGWRVEMGEDRVRIELNYGRDVLDLALPAPQMVPYGGLGMKATDQDMAQHYFFSDLGLGLDRRDALCHDAMSGRPYPQTVNLSTAKGVLNGCGGETVDLLTGAEWRIEQPASGTQAAAAPVTITFDRAGTVSGQSGCNRFHGAFEITGEGGLQIGPLASTRMACEAPVMAAERDLLQTLDGVQSFDIDTTGALILRHSTEEVLRATR
ncbi:META domain-containing protein [Rhodobacteraceae bacterium]|nr:META domain-containing protein [Paracoccaceae bacterium]